ncbi:hypothetical protein K505DRAFT_359229 [Melanomma pulvis-pyrius CBS 109.77]|uniref:Uncharacterized protein n=1 Tax=Melanomma pulvis-pyrius CBS 109.77 TaxID=1314802 RepID=A0A6A6XK94_9PLEO|nr:hypothetical protein K505DRAFT_359229 [Melanomma pulvis-pyrius CBS 109.77]
MMRWYMARKKVFEKIQQRDIIRSRLLSHQVSVANSLARKQEILVRELVDENDRLEFKLSQLNGLVTYTNESIKRLAHDHNEIKDLILKLSISSTQNDRI